MWISRNRRFRGSVWVRSLVVVVSLGLILTACGGSDSEAAASNEATTVVEGGGASTALTPATFRLDWIITGEHTHFYAALEQGFFEEEGLDVEILEGGGSALALQQVANKDDDFGLAGFDALAASRAEGLPATMVANIFRRSPHVVLSLAETGIESPADLEGKTVGGAAGSSPTTMFNAFLEAADVDADAVEMVNLDAASYIPALLEGRIDAFVGFAPSQYPILLASTPEPPNVLYYADSGVVTVSTGVVVHPDTIEERPEVVGGFVRAVQRGLQWTLDNQEEAVEMMTARFPRSVEAEEAALAVEQVGVLAFGERTADAPIGWMSEEDAQQTLETLQKYADLGEIEPLENYYTNEFIDEDL
ncbi:MAG: transporter substrate-binding domain-containing protein [Acidimicrobiia bacterium]|nr:transporter substrate-binding domain-containing protein [Acidimicrobiia bacterium]